MLLVLVCEEVQSHNKNLFVFFISDCKESSERDLCAGRVLETAQVLQRALCGGTDQLAGSCVT